MAEIISDLRRYYEPQPLSQAAPPKSIDPLGGPRPRPRANCRACLDFQLPGVLALNSCAHLCVWVERTSEVTDRSRFSGGFGDRQKMRDMSRDAHG